MNMMTIGLMLKAYDQMSSVVNLASTKSINSLNKVQAQMKRISEQSKALGQNALGTGIAASLPIMAATKTAAAFEDTLRDIAITGEMTAKQESALGRTIRQSALQFNQLHSSVAEGIQVLTAGGIQDAMELQKYAPILSKTATATRASVGDLGSVLLAFRNNLGIQASQSEQALNILTKAGKLGQFEILDMAKWLPSLSPMFQALGIQGPKAVAQMGAALQIARMGAGSNDEAANNFRNFMGKIIAPDTIKDFSKAGINLKASLNGLVNKGLDPVSAMLQIITNAVGKEGPAAAKAFETALKSKDEMERQMALSRLQEATKLGALFQDLQVLNFLRPAMANAEQMKSMQAQSLAAGNAPPGKGIIDEDFAKRMATTTEQMKKLKIGLAEISISLGTALLPSLNAGITALAPWVDKISVWAEANPELVKGIVAWGGALTFGVGGAAMAVSWLARGVSAMVSVWRGGLVVWRLAAAGLGLVRGQIVGLMVAQRAQLAIQALQNAIAYRGGAWNALQFALMNTKYRMLEGVGAMRGWVAASALWVRGNLLSVAGLRGLAAALAGGLVNGLKGAALAARAFSLALLTNPIGWLVAIIAGGALLIYRNWKPISSFFSGLWSGIKVGFGPLAPAFKAIGAVLAGAFKPILGPLKSVWNWLSGLFTQTDNNGKAAKKLGFEWGKAIGEMLKGAVKWGVGMAVELAKAVSHFKQAAGKFYDAGAEIMAGLWRGLLSGWDRVSNSVKKMASDLAGTFKGMLGIHSPSKVFMGFGENISHGAAIGIMGGQYRAIKAANDMAAGVAGASRSAKILPFNRMAGPVSPQVYGPVAMPRQAPGAGSAQPAQAGNFSINITINAKGGGDVRQQVEAGLNDAYRQFEANMKRYDSERRRRAF